MAVGPDDYDSPWKDAIETFLPDCLAHPRAQETRQDPSARLSAKLGALRRLYTRGYNREQIVGIFRFVDWLMALPPGLERRFREEMEAFEEEQKIPYITSVERIGREEGRREGRQEGLQEGLEQGLRQGLLDGIELALKLKFGGAGLEIVSDVRELTDLAVIRAVYAQIEAVGTIQEVRRVYR